MDHTPPSIIQIKPEEVRFDVHPSLMVLQGLLAFPLAESIFFSQCCRSVSVESGKASAHGFVLRLL